MKTCDVPGCNNWWVWSVLDYAANSGRSLFCEKHYDALNRLILRHLKKSAEMFDLPRRLQEALA